MQYALRQYNAIKNLNVKPTSLKKKMTTGSTAEVAELQIEPQKSKLG